MAPIKKIARQVMYEEFAGKVRDLIRRERLEGKYLASERDLGKLFGVSRETVRKGLALLETGGNIRRHHGRGNLVLSRKAVKSGRLPIIVATLGMNSVPGHLTDVMAGLSETGANKQPAFAFLNLALPEARTKLLKDLSNGRAAGVLLAGIADKDLVISVRDAWDGPVVLVDHYFHDLPLTGVVDDSETGATQATEHLISLGHRRIAYLEISARDLNPWRYSGYAKALEKAGLQVSPELVVPSFASYESGRRAGEALLALPDPPTAVFAFDDIRAWGVWRAAEARGLTVGGNFALVGYGDQSEKIGLPDELTSVHFDVKELWRSALQELQLHADGGADVGRHVMIPTELRVRKSSANARRKE